MVPPSSDLISPPLTTTKKALPFQIPSAGAPSRPTRLFSRQMDWQGQKLAELLMQVMLVVFAAVAFVTGYVLGSFQLMLLIYAGGVVLTSLVTIPNWPFFNRHPLKWLDPIEAELHPRPQVSAPKKKASKVTQK